MHRSITLCGLILALALQAAAETLPMWEYTDAHRISHLELTLEGNIFLSTREATRVLDAATGEPVWSRNDIRDCRMEGGIANMKLKCDYLDTGRAEYSRIPGTGYAMLRDGDRLGILDLKTGEIRLDTKDLAMEKVRRYQYQAPLHQFLVYGTPDDRFLIEAYDLRDGARRWSLSTRITHDFEWLHTLDDGTILVYGKDHEGRKSVALLDPLSGGFRWESQDLLTEDARTDAFRPAPIRDTASTLIVSLGRDGPMRLGPGGDALWRIDSLGGVDLSGMALRGGVLYVLRAGRVFGIDAASGDVLWARQARFVAESLLLHPRGILLASDDELDLVSLEGDPFWNEPVEMPNGWNARRLDEESMAGALRVPTPVIFREDTLYFAGYDRLVSVDLAAGRLNELVRLRPREGETPDFMELFGNRLVLSSDQTLRAYTLDGQEVFHHFYRAPTPPLLGQLLAGAALFGGMPLGAFAPVSSGGSLSGVFSELGEAFANTAGHGLAYAFGDNPDAQMLQSLRKRYRPASHLGRESYFYLDHGDGDDAHRFGFLRVDRATARVTGSAWPNRRSLEGALDARADTVYFKTEPNVIQAVRFEAGEFPVDTED